MGEWLKPALRRKLKLSVKMFCSCWPCFPDKTEKDLEAKYKESRSVVIVQSKTPPQTPEVKVKAAAHVRFASTEVVSLATALRTPTRRHESVAQ